MDKTHSAANWAVPIGIVVLTLLLGPPLGGFLIWLYGIITTTGPVHPSKVQSLQALLLYCIYSYFFGLLAALASSVYLAWRIAKKHNVQLWVYFLLAVLGAAPFKFIISFGIDDSLARQLWIVAQMCVQAAFFAALVFLLIWKSVLRNSGHQLHTSISELVTPIVTRYMLLWPAIAGLIKFTFMLIKSATYKHVYAIPGYNLFPMHTKFYLLLPIQFYLYWLVPACICGAYLQRYAGRRQAFTPWKYYVLAIIVSYISLGIGPAFPGVSSFLESWASTVSTGIAALATAFILLHLSKPNLEKTPYVPQPGSTILPKEST